MLKINGRQRAIIEWISPNIDTGKYPLKKIPYQKISLKAKIYADGFHSLRAKLVFRQVGQKNWQAKELQYFQEDIWETVFWTKRIGIYEYAVKAWTDDFLTWRNRLAMRSYHQIATPQDIWKGEKIIEKALPKASKNDKIRLQIIQNSLKKLDFQAAIAVALSPELKELIAPYADEQHACWSEKLPLWIESPKALFSAWYEFFPRSTSPHQGKHGTFADAQHILPRIAYMGFDVIYLPPIHPIGKTFRKGKNNSDHAQTDDVGSPWAIGSPEGGHKSIHPKLGNFEDFALFLKRARQHALEVALDLALHCSPDHPYVGQFPQWFARHADGSLVYAENPPHEYKDIVFFDFENPDWQNLWQELLSIVIFWAEKGIKIFRVDNPHTKPFLFWEWLIRESKKKFPEIIFLAEAFTRPALMYQLSKIGFTQSYTYFAWRNEKHEIQNYFEQISPLKDFFRPNLWANTPDVLSKYLQFGGENAFTIRLVLAATLSASYGIYGPVFELGWTHGTFGGEEYYHSEKYEIRNWDWNFYKPLQGIIRKINRIRKEQKALQSDDYLFFQPTDNEKILAYLRMDFDKKNKILVVVNLDSFHKQVAHVFVQLEQAQLRPQVGYWVRDLYTKKVYRWENEKNYVELSAELPFHIFRIEEIFP